MRFRRRIRIAPGVRLNLSGSGVSISAGPRGASLTAGTKGLWGNLGIPGTGIYNRRKLSGRASSPGAGRVTRKEQEALLLDDFFASRPRLSAPAAGGPLELIDGDGNALSPLVQETAWKHLRAGLLEQLAERCDALKADIEGLGRLHEQTPPPEPVLQYRRNEFHQPEPAAPQEQPYHRLWKLLPWHRKQIDAVNDTAREEHSRIRKQWLSLRAAHDRAEEARRKQYRLRDQGSVPGIEEFISAHLATLQWPQDTAVDLKFDLDRKRAYLDVDFPEIEDLPEGIPEPAPRTRGVRIKKFSDAARRRLYAAHIHSVLLRLIGETFRTSELVHEVIASGYSQRPDPATGAIQDEYLISLKVPRSAWREIDFSNLEQVDPIEAIARFEHVRKMTKTGIFRRIDPME
ncbi:DUF4236 domain-containing protein [Luteimonas sp. JM171]|uniref:DUF4236 domain-containing protein n=1 Tax=Luteimonas sp. JM171 TaxID=1896164 RepID=UPI000B071501|nr:DUF4236 domain-containing protein [Luteimonas sp. JM171]